MKNLIITICFLCAFQMMNAQVLIGDNSNSSQASNNTSVLLDFTADGNKGIILPYVRQLPNGPGLVGGTFVLDATTPNAANVKYYDCSQWVNLSGTGTAGDVTTELASQLTLTESQEITTANVIIGEATSPADGVLVLESGTKAMVLPIVTDVNNIPSPSPGLMVYVSGTATNPYKRFAVYNGAIWSFWKLK